MKKYSFINSFTDQKYILCSKSKPRLEVEKCVNIKIHLYADYFGLNKPGLGSRIALSSQLPNVVVLDNLPSRKMIFWPIFFFFPFRKMCIREKDTGVPIIYTAIVSEIL